MLWPQTYQDPPDPEKLEKHIRDKDEVPNEVIEGLADEQLKSIAFNESVIKIKAFSLKGVLLLSTIATILLGWEIGQGRGT